MLSWLLDQSWKFWLILILVVLFILWVIFGGQSHQFIGLKPLYADVNAAELVNDQTTNYNSVQPPSSNPEWSHDEFQPDLNNGSSQNTTIPSIQPLIVPRSFEDNIDILTSRKTVDYGEHILNPKLSPVPPVSYPNFKRNRLTPNQSLKSPYRPPSSSNFRIPDSDRALSTPIPNYHTPRYNSIDRAGEHRRRIVQGANIGNTDRFIVPDPRNAQSSALNKNGNGRNIQVLKYIPMPEGSQKVEPDTSNNSQTKEIDTKTYGGNVSAKRNKAESRGEAICRQALEKIYNRKFPSSRPDFLQNPETGYNLELDGYNEELQIGFEYNGIQHYIFPNWIHRSYEDFEKQIRRDQYKINACDRSSVYVITNPY